MLDSNPRGFVLVCLIGLLFWFVVGYGIVYADPLFGGTINDDMGDDGVYAWVKDHDPSHLIRFTTDPTLKFCPAGTKACAIWRYDACTIYTPREWTDEDWNIDRHELRHCAGWIHQPANYNGFR